VHKNVNYLNLNLNKYYKDQDIEVCVGDIAVYRATCSNFNMFLIRLNSIIKSLYKAKLKFIICCDINIDYCMNSDKKTT
jgi:hypothetical protein